MDDSIFIDHNQLMQFVEEIMSYEDIKVEDIPEYSLYISQLEEFFDKKLGRVGGNDEERKAISKTMIQNYIKEGLLMPPDGKCYNHNHIILLALIYNLKSILTIKDIKKLLTPILIQADDEANNNKIEHIYDIYLELKGTDTYANFLANNIKIIKKYLEQEKVLENEWDNVSLLLLVLTLVEQANVRKKIAEYIINNIFHLNQEM